MKTTNNYNKIWAHILVIFYSACAFSQDAFVTRPDNASMLHTGEIPVNLYTGVPDISIPIYTMPTHSRDISLNLGLNYHPAGLSALDQPGNMGRGWNINAVGVITRSVVWRVDERHSTPALDDYDRMTDIYQFSFMGQSGRFMIKKNFQTNTFSIQMMDHSTLKIEYVFNSEDKKVNSFTIYDDRGYRYVFDVYDINIGRFWMRDNIHHEYVDYRSAHYLSKVYDNNGNILLSYVFDTVTKPTSFGDKVFNRLREINATDIGKAAFSYTYTAPQSGDAAGYNPPIKDVTITNMKGQIIQKTAFSYAYGTSGELTKVSEFSGDLSESRDYKLYYNTRGLPQKDTRSMYDFPLQGWLEKITLPTGGTILYEFDWNTAGFAGYLGSAPDYDQYYLENNPDNAPVREPYGDGGGDYDTSVSKSMPFTVTGSVPKKLEFSFWHNPYSYPPELDPTAGPLPVGYRIMSGSTVVHDFGSWAETGTATLAPGSYTIAISTVSTLNTTGNISIMHDVPNGGILRRWIYTSGMRIKRIATFSHDANANYLYNPGNYQYTPASETFYDYSMPDDPTRSSGYEYDGYILTFDEPLKMVSQLTGYTNVKVTKGSGNGYTRYAFARYDDYPIPFANDNITSLRAGMLKKTEIFDEAGTMLSKTENTYELTATGDTFPIFPAYEGEWNYISTRLSWPKLTASTATEKLGDNLVTSTQVFTYNNVNKQIASRTATTSTSGETLKTEYYYHTGNSPLSMNRMAHPEKTDNYLNSTLLSTEKINYSNSWPGNQSYLLSSTAQSVAGGPLVTKSKVNRYDTFGNLLEKEQPNGIKTSYIWGYNKTLLVAKIEGIAYSDIPPALITAIENTSATGTEADLLVKLADLRSSLALAVTMLTTYTHKPLVGTTTITDTMGDKTVFEYDSFGRLKTVRDRNGKVLNETKYHMITQN
ncbi:RHS repeat domain-containing protein [Sphingobacterium siyangense]|uniref:RHS repeat domain-containing protein n=1 Tax=Sphingobacterium siyangense TaxID=459529 RepID=UPI002FDA0680